MRQAITCQLCIICQDIAWRLAEQKRLSRDVLRLDRSCTPRCSELASSDRYTSCPAPCSDRVDWHTSPRSEPVLPEWDRRLEHSDSSCRYPVLDRTRASPTGWRTQSSPHHRARNAHQSGPHSASAQDARRLLRTLERHTNRSYVEKHPLRTTLGGTLQGDETIPRIPIDPFSVCVRNDAAASYIIGDSKCDPEDFGNERVSEAFARKSAVYRESRQQNQRQFVWRKAAHIFLWEGVPWHTCRRDSEISNHDEQSPFVDRHISHTDGAFLLIRPGMALQIIVERLVATVERLDFVVFFETTDENRHSASHCPDEGFRRMGGFSRCEIGKALQFARRPGNFHAREHDLWRDAFEPRQHQFLARARFSFTKNAMAALSFPYCPTEQC